MMLMYRIKMLKYAIRCASMFAHCPTVEEARTAWEVEKQSKWAMKLPHDLYIECYSDETFEKLMKKLNKMS